MDDQDAPDGLKQERSRLPPWMRNIYHDMNNLSFAIVGIAIFERFFFSDAFLETRFLIWVAKTARVGVKLALAALQSSVDFAVGMALAFLVFPLHFWRSPARPIQDDRYLAAWVFLASAASTAISALDDYRGKPRWRDLARVNPALLCKSAEPFSLYTTCSHYAALIMLLAEIEDAFRYHQWAVQERADETPEAELTGRRIWMYRIRFLVWSLLAQFSINVALELVSDASGSLQCWYAQQGMTFLDFLPRTLRQVPSRVCVLGFHYLLRSWCFSYITWCFSYITNFAGELADPDNWDDDDDDEEDQDWDDEEDAVVLPFLLLFLLLVALVIVVGEFEYCRNAFRAASLNRARGAGVRGHKGGVPA